MYECMDRYFCIAGLVGLLMLWKYQPSLPAFFAGLFSLRKNERSLATDSLPPLNNAFSRSISTTIHPVSRLVMLLHLPSGKFPFILTSTSYWVPVAVLIVVPFLSALLSVVFGKARVLVALLVALLVARQRLFRGVRDEGQVEFAGPPGPLRYAGVVAPLSDSSSSSACTTSSVSSFQRYC